MPELSDDMYCSQQIMVPPMFPYILRQYAKAAIRSQPTDLLRWSTAYFRCLSLNLPPPVKPRLEYPLPKDYDGVTPGWLKALLFQFAGSSHADFKVLWDRWIGACQNHLTLIKILCLGGFTDAMAIPLLRFIGLCVGFLSENLTQTMILFCEVVTEEPEGGSAMISVETFIDVYTFLAEIDASADQILLNRYFPDELLELLQKKKEKAEEAGEEEEEDEDAKRKKKRKVDKDLSVASETIEEESKAEDQLDALSCPDLADDQTGHVSSEESDLLNKSQSTIIDDQARVAAALGKAASQVEMIKEGEEKKREKHVAVLDEEPGEGGFISLSESDIAGDASASALVDSDLSSIKSEEEGSKTELLEATVEQTAAIDEEDELKNTPVASSTSAHPESDALEAPKVASAEPSTSAHEFDKGTKLEGEEVEEEQVVMDKYAEEESLGAESVTETYVESEPPKIAPVELLGEYSVEEEPVAPEEEEIVVEGKFTVEEVFVEAIPGIGPVVPKELVDAVVEYMKGCAATQHGMVMPRNIRHYSCPPLEVYA